MQAAVLKSVQSFLVRNTFDSTKPLSIYEHSKHLIGKSLHSLFGDEIMDVKYRGKGAVGHMVEELLFGYSMNSNREADFANAGVELKCTPLKKLKDNTYKIKERLVCSMIDYHEIVETAFEDSHVFYKCKLMLILYYLHVNEQQKLDYEFLFRILWQLPYKDILLLKADYERIAEKVRRGEAHLLSEGDTLYLGACRKGTKGDGLQKQPYSATGAKKRAFSLKPSYQRYILEHVINSGNTYYTNYVNAEQNQFQLVTESELKYNSFEDIIISRFSRYIGKDYNEMCQMLGIQGYQSKSKYADVAGLIASNTKNKRLDKAEEFIKSGITMKTVRLSSSGIPKESMSFHNIDYFEVMENHVWEESDLYELFTTRFMFVVLEPINNRQLALISNKTHTESKETAYTITKVFFWTMPTSDLELAKDYWVNIRNNVINNNIKASAFWKLNDHQKFHVRPKGTKKYNTTENPHGGKCQKYCYWFNAEYVKSILDNQK